MYERLTGNLYRAIKNLKKDVPLKKIFDETALLEEKRDFIASTYLMFCQYFGAFLTSEDSKFKDQLETLEIVPALEDSEQDNEWLEIWVKIYDSNWNNDRLQVDIFEEFFQPDYNPPDDLLKLMAHLQFLHIYFAYIAQAMPTVVNSRMDLAMGKLAETARMAIDSIEKSGWDYHRVKLSKEKSASLLSGRQQPIFEEYYRIKGRDKLSRHGLAVKIRARLNEKSKNLNGKKKYKAPHTDTIKRYLREEGLID